MFGFGGAADECMVRKPVSREKRIVHLSQKLHIQKRDAKINGGGYSPLSPLVPTPMCSAYVLYSSLEVVACKHSIL